MSFVCLLEIHLHFPDNGSLKGKRKELQSLKEQLRSASYRRVLMSQLLNDDRIKSYVAEILSDEKRLPAPTSPAERNVVAEATTPATTPAPAPAQEPSTTSSS